MESTGKYWIPVFNILEPSCNITLVHPKYVKAIRGKKTDKKDAQWIADLFKHDLIAGSSMPPLPIRQLRDLMRYRFKLTNFSSSEKNRLQNSLTVSNIQLGNVVSDTFGKRSMNILDKLLDDPTDTSFDLEPLVHGSLKGKLPELELTIDGFITPEQAGKIKVIKQHYEDLESRKAELESMILSLAESYSEEINLILTVPSFKNIFSAIAVILGIVSIWTCSRQPSICAPGQDSHHPMMEAPARKSQSGFRELASTSSLFWYSALPLLSKVRSIPKSETATYN